MPAPDDWVKQWKQNPQAVEKPKLVPVDFKGAPTVSTAGNDKTPVATVQALC